MEKYHTNVERMVHKVSQQVVLESDLGLTMWVAAEQKWCGEPLSSRVSREVCAQMQ